MSKFQIAHIVYSGFGGTTDYIFNLIRGDKNKEFNHSIIFYGIEDTGVATIKFAESIAHTVVVIIKKTGRDKSAISSLKSNLQKLQPLAVTLHVNSLIVDSKKWMPDDARLIFVEHQAHQLKSKKEWIFSALAQFKSTAIISLTTEAQESLRKKMNVLYRSKKNIIVPTGIFVDDYRSNENKPVFKIGMTGRINEYRDHETLIRAFLELKNDKIELHIAGDGPLLSTLKNKYNSAQIIFHGLLDRNEVADFLADLSLYVHASFGETSSLAIKQAQASKLPIIASAVEGIINVLNGNAVLVPAGNVYQLKIVLEKIISNPSLRQELIHKSNQATQNSPNCFDMFEAYKNLFE